MRTESRANSLLPGNAAIIFNPEAGIGSLHTKKARVQKAATRLERHGWQVEVSTTGYAGQENELTQHALRQGATVIFAAGGDGTANNMLGTLINEKSSIALGMLPFGTVNLWARETGIPKDPTQAVDVQLAGEIRQMDVGSVNGRLFRNVLGIGFDGDVLHKISSLRTRTGHRLLKGSPLYFASTALEYPFYSPTEATVTVDGEEFQQSFMQTWIGNTKLLAYMELRPEARVNDGLMEVTIFPKMNLRALARNSAPALRRFVMSQPGERVPAASYYQGAACHIETRIPLHAQVDGEALTKAPTNTFEIRTKPGALNVLLPANPKNQKMFN